MGVFGLHRFVKERSQLIIEHYGLEDRRFSENAHKDKDVAAQDPEVQKVDTKFPKESMHTLLIDSVNFGFHLSATAVRVNAKMMRTDLGVTLGGDPRREEELLTAFIKKLYFCGVRVVFLHDGPKWQQQINDPARREVHLERERNKQENMRSSYNYCLKKTQQPPKEMMLPCYTMTQMERVIHGLALDGFHCEYLYLNCEVDHVIGPLVAQTQAIGIMTGDSDFFLMKVRCFPLVEFDGRIVSMSDSSIVVSDVPRIDLRCVQEYSLIHALKFSSIEDLWWFCSLRKCRDCRSVVGDQIYRADIAVAAASFRSHSWSIKTIQEKLPQDLCRTVCNSVELYRRGASRTLEDLESVCVSDIRSMDNYVYFDPLIFQMRMNSFVFAHLEQTLHRWNGITELRVQVDEIGTIQVVQVPNVADPLPNMGTREACILPEHRTKLLLEALCIPPTKTLLQPLFMEILWITLPFLRSKDELTAIASALLFAHQNLEEFAEDKVLHPSPRAFELSYVLSHSYSRFEKICRCVIKCNKELSNNLPEYYKLFSVVMFNYLIQQKDTSHVISVVSKEVYTAASNVVDEILSRTNATNLRSEIQSECVNLFQNPIKIIQTANFTEDPLNICTLQSGMGQMNLRDPNENTDSDSTQENADSARDLVQESKALPESIVKSFCNYASVRLPQLPIDEHLPHILDAINKQTVVCIHGNTGCGKSTKIPFAIHCDAKQRGLDHFILVTQPRRIAATSLAQHVSNMLGEPLGQHCGYRISNGRSESSKTKIMYTTTGYAVVALANSNLFSKVTHIVLDEAHERDLDGDLLCLFLRFKATSNPRVKIIIMSATLQAKLYSKYFKGLNGDKTPQTLVVGGKCFPVEEVFLEEYKNWRSKQRLPSLPDPLRKNLDSYVSKLKSKPAVPNIPHRLVCTLVLQHVVSETCILVFLPGIIDIETCHEELTKQPSQNSVSIQFHILHSVIPLAAQHAATKPCAKGVCKVILSTNIAETSLTIPDVKIVIDCGGVKRVQYDVAKQLELMSTSWCSRSAATQRAGRAGRLSNGTVIRLYTREIFHSMQQFECLELEPLDLTVLKIATMLKSVASIRDLCRNLPEAPSEYRVECVLQKLTSSSLISEHVTKKGVSTLTISPYGHFIASLPLNFELSSAIFLALIAGCGPEMIIIASALAQQKSLFTPIFSFFYDSDVEYHTNVRERVKLLFKLDDGDFSDLLIYIKIYQLVLLRQSRVRERFLNARSVSDFVSRVSSICQSILNFSQCFPEFMHKTHISEETMNQIQKIARKKIDQHVIQVFRSTTVRMQLTLILALFGRNPVQVLVQKKARTYSQDVPLEFQLDPSTILINSAPAPLLSCPEAVLASRMQIFSGLKTVPKILIKEKKLYVRFLDDKQLSNGYPLHIVPTETLIRSSRAGKFTMSISEQSVFNTKNPIRKNPHPDSLNLVPRPVPEKNAKLFQKDTSVRMERYSILSEVYLSTYKHTWTLMYGYSWKSIVSDGDRNSLFTSDAFLVDDVIPGFFLLVNLAIAQVPDVTLCVQPNGFVKSAHYRGCTQHYGTPSQQIHLIHLLVASNELIRLQREIQAGEFFGADALFNRISAFLRANADSHPPTTTTSNGETCSGKCEQRKLMEYRPYLDLHETLDGSSDLQYDIDAAERWVSEIAFQKPS